MHLEASQLAKVTPLPVPPPGSPAAPTVPGRFAQVYDLAAERERRSPPHAAALAAVEEAARVYRELDAAGLQVRLDLTRGVSAQLQSHDGALVRPLSLHDVVDPSGLLPPDAA
jgi:hypothetical protein